METKTPEEKSLELIEKFRRHAKIDAGTIVVTRTESAKQCAIICCEEILKSYELTNDNHGTIYKFWQQVIEKIKSL